LKHERSVLNPPDKDRPLLFHHFFFHYFLFLDFFSACLSPIALCHFQATISFWICFYRFLIGSLPTCICFFSRLLILSFVRFRGLFSFFLLILILGRLLLFFFFFRRWDDFVEAWVLWCERFDPDCSVLPVTVMDDNRRLDHFDTHSLDDEAGQDVIILRTHLYWLPSVIILILGHHFSEA